MIDESNIEFCDSKSLIEEELTPNLIILKSFSKAYGLANLRIGYLICSKVLREKYMENITTNEFSGISIYYANKSICSNYYQKNVEKVNKEIKYLKNNLSNIGIETLDTYSNTIFTTTVFNSKFIEILELNDISVVPIIDQCDKLHLRIACQTHKINKDFIEKLKQIKNIRQYIL